MQAVKQGELASEFMGEKVCYFLQRFGAKKYLKLDFVPNYYGPYSGKVNHVLYYLNGSYLTGYGAKDKKPFESISIIMDAEEDIIKFIGKDSELMQIAKKTNNFLDGYYSEFALELLSSIDFLMETQNTNDINEIKLGLRSWNSRKKSLFNNDKFIENAIHHLSNSELRKH
jgi:hypothetical protein